MKQEFNHFALMVDNSRNAVMKPDTVKKMIDILEMVGYNSLILYMEDTYEVDNQPYFGYLRGRYSKEEIKEMDAYAAEHGVELIPFIQTLGHLGRVQNWPVYAKLFDVEDVLCIGEEPVYELIEDMFRTLNECFTSRIVQIGMDEANMLGLGNYLRKNGYRDRLDIFCEHLERVAAIAKKYGFTCCVTSDMFYVLTVGSYRDKRDMTPEMVESIQSRLPENVKLQYWNYHTNDRSHYDFMLDSHLKIQKDIWFTGGLWTWTGFAPHNRWSIESCTPALLSCMERGIKDVTFNAWGDGGMECARFAMLPSLFYVACLGKGITDEAEIKRKFEQTFDIAYDDFLLMDLVGTANDYLTADAEKYLLYNDCFLGIMDKAVRPSEELGYVECAKKLKPLINHPQWGYMFETMYALCKLLAVKTTVGIKTRTAYQECKIDELRELISDYEQILFWIDRFYTAFEKQWMIENKPHGFDVHDIRIGGLKQRVEHCKKRLEAYVNGEISALPELEETILKLMPELEPPYIYSVWHKICTANYL